MAVKYFCDVCKKEIDRESRVHLMGNRNIIDVLCKECWDKAEDWLLSKSKRVDSSGVAKEIVIPSASEESSTHIN